MMLLLQPDDTVSWLAPYAYGIVFLGFAFFLFRVFENWYADTFDKPIYRNLFSYRKLSKPQLTILENELHFFRLLTTKEKRQFEHRVSKVISQKQFIGREGLTVTDRMKVLIAGVGCMLSFGRKNYNYGLIEYVLVYPNEFYSELNQAHHKGEFNPRGKALVLSWEHFEEGYQITNDNLNLGIHEFMHAMQLEAKRGRDLDSNRLTKQFQNILKRLTQEEVKNKLDETRFFRALCFYQSIRVYGCACRIFFRIS